MIKPVYLRTTKIPLLGNLTVIYPSYVLTLLGIVRSEPDFSQEDYVRPSAHSARTEDMFPSHGNLDPPEVHSYYSICHHQISTISSELFKSGAVSRNEERIIGGSEKSISPVESMCSQNFGLVPKAPTHSRWRKLVSRYEIPRKFLHISIGFFIISLYFAGFQMKSITNFLMFVLVLITIVDFLRFRYEALNKIFIYVCRPLMRESEYWYFNGVIWYIIGSWFALMVFPKDIGLMGILLLALSDTAASVVGRAFGRHTPSIRQGKSLAGSGAAFAVGCATALAFWGSLTMRSGPFSRDHDTLFMFTGTLHLPKLISNSLYLTDAQASANGWPAVIILSTWTGFTASASEAIAFYGLDDNVTIPALSGLGMWGFLRLFGQHTTQ